MVINGVELQDLDVFDADVAEKYEEALGKVSKDMTVTDDLKGSEIIRHQCNVIYKCFDEIFGEGTAKKIFGEKDNIVTCLEALEKLILETNKKASKLKEIHSKYSPNRVKRNKR